MAGHSKWHNIKRKKGAIDAKRGRLFTKLIREIQVAARMSGADMNSNPRLRDAIKEAKSNNVTKDTIERAIRRGTGDGDGSAQFEEILYEGYGPGGTALLIESLTDNRNRTVSELRATMVRNGGSLGEQGTVAWMFDRCGLITIRKESANEDVLMEYALESGATDLKLEGDFWEIITPSTELFAVRSTLEEHDIAVESAQLTYLPKTSVELKGENAQTLLKLLDVLEDLDDVQKIHANFEIDDAELEALQALG